MRDAAPTPATVVLLLRHGESDHNAAGLMQGSSDRPRLTRKGEAQARAAAAMLPAQVDALFVSPLARALRTAAVLRTVRPDLPAAEVWSELREIDLPEWEGRAFADIDREDAERRALWRCAPDLLVMRGTDGQAMRPCHEVFTRAAMVIARLRALPPGQTVLVVAHSGSIRATMALLFGLPRARLHALAQDNGAAHRLLLKPDGVCLLGFGELAGPPSARIGRALGRCGPLVVLAPAAAAPALAACSGLRLGHPGEAPGADGRVVIPGDATARSAALACFAAIPPAAALALTPGRHGLHAFIPAGPHGPAVITLLNASTEPAAEPAQEL